jgi:cytoskeletal protein RodZ
MERFSDYLRTHRERKGIQLEEIASITKIHVRNLELMESGHWHELPPEPFIRGFIIAYAKYVGLDGKDTLERFYAENRPATTRTNEEDPTASTELAAEVIEQNRGIPFAAIGAGVALSLVVGVAGALIYIGGQEPNAAVTTDASTTEESQRETAGANTSAPSPQAAPVVAEKATDKSAGTAEVAKAAAPPVPEVQRTPLPPGFEHEVSIALGKRSWVKVVVDGEKPKESVLPEGEKLTVIAKKKVKVVIANADGAKVLHNGVVQPGIAVRGPLRAYRFPANAQFPQDVPPPKQPEPESSDSEASPAAASDGATSEQ